jgi:hypothetical protein
MLSCSNIKENEHSVQIYKKKLANYLLQFFKFCFLTILVFALFSGCHKRQDTMLSVYIRDKSGSQIEGAKVKVFGEPTNSNLNKALSIDLEKISDKTGSVVFNLNEFYDLGQTGMAIVKVRAIYYNKSGENVIHLIEEKNNMCFVEID